MNKKTLRTAGWALGLSMVVAGIGTVVGTSLRAPVEAKAAGTDTTKYSLINSTSDLTAGASYLITSGTTGSVKTMSVNSNTNNRPAADATVSNGKITRGSSAMSVTLGGSSGAWTLSADNYKGSGSYFGQGNQTSSNYLKIYSEVGDGANGDTWTISFSGDAAVITSTKKSSRNLLRYNSANNIFSCYTSGQQPVYLWKEVSEASGYTVSFDSDGGSVSPDNIELEKDETFEFPSAGIKAGYLFAGWSSDGGTTKYQVGDTSPAVTANIEYTAYWTADPIDTVTVAKGTFKTEYFEGEEWDWEHLVVTYTTQGGAGGTAEGLTKEDFVFTPSAPAIGVESVSVQATFGEVTSAAFVINGLTVEEAPLEYEITFGSTHNTNPTEIKTGADFRSVYSVPSEVTVGDLTKIYGISTSELKCGSGSASAGISFTVPEDRYITKVDVKVAAGNDAQLGVTSGATGAKTESQGIVKGTLTFDDNLATEKSNKVTLASSASGAFYLSSIKITYVMFDPELSASINTFDVATNGQQIVNLTPSYFTPTSYEASILSGTSLTASSVEFSGNAATITAGESTGVSVVRITGTDGVKSAHVDITVNVTEPRNLLGLEIIGDGQTVEFKVGQAFDPGLLQVRATFDAEPTEVIYSAENSNLNLLTFEPVLGHVFTEEEIGAITVRISLTVGTGSDLAVYGANVVDKTYAAKTQSVTDLWEGQYVSFGNAEGTKVSGSHTGGNQLPGVDAVVNETRGLCIEDSPNAAAYRVHREMIDGKIYYSFFRGGYYLQDTSASDKNYLGRSATLDDACRFTVTFEDGLASIENKGNTAKPSLRWNSGSNYFACYSASSSVEKGVAIYASIAYDEFAVAGQFENSVLHMLDYDPGHLDENKNIGWCKDEEHGYYANAKAVWNAMSEDERAAVSDDARARLAAWAVANGDVLNENSPIAAANNVRSSALKRNQGSVIAIASVLGAGALLTGGFFLLRKKKEN